MSAGYPCPRCGAQLQWVAQYGQYYCQQCQQYVPAQAPAAQPKKDAVDDFFGGISKELGFETTPCPNCGAGATFNKQYNRWYCGNCQRWL